MLANEAKYNFEQTIEYIVYALHMHIEQLHRFKLMFSIVLNDRLFSPLMSMFIMFFSRIVNCLFSALVLLIFKLNRENVIISIAIRLTQKKNVKLLFVAPNYSRIEFSRAVFRFPDKISFFEKDLLMLYLNIIMPSATYSVFYLKSFLNTWI